MQKLFYEVNSLDKRCYEDFGLSEDILMENAANSLCEVIRKNSSIKDKIVFICGPGNNGADGIASARILQNEYNISIFTPLGIKSKMANLQMKRAKTLHVKKDDALEEADIYVDCIFGSGLNKELNKEISELLVVLNSKKALKIACDIPTGIDIDGDIKTEAFHADITVTMGALKHSLYSDKAKEYVGNIVVANLGVSRQTYEKDSDVFLLEKTDMKLPFRNKANTNKGSYGHTCILSGQKNGASVLCATAAFNFGSGLVSVLSAKDINLPPFLMSIQILPTNTSVVVAGMGLGKMHDEKLYDFLLAHAKPLVLDADLFYEEIIVDILEKKENVVLTPHPKEFSSLLKLTGLCDVSVHEIQKNRIKYVKEFSQKYPHVVLLLKGANTIITKDTKIYINSLGSSRLAKGGSGDVLAGMIGSLIAQNYDILEASVSASLAHALAAESLKSANYALNPLDICEGIKWL